jgi:hypothetical protein
MQGAVVVVAMAELLEQVAQAVVEMLETRAAEVAVLLTPAVAVAGVVVLAQASMVAQAMS